MLGVFIQTGCVCLQKSSHLVDEGTGSSGTDTVHTLLDVSVFEVYDLRVLAAELDSNIGLRSLELQGGRNGDDLLHERNINVLRESKTAGSGDDRVNLNVARDCLGLLQQIGQSFLDLCKMPPIIREQNMLFQIQNNNLDGCRTNINT